MFCQPARKAETLKSASHALIGSKSRKLDPVSKVGHTCRCLFYPQGRLRQSCLPLTIDPGQFKRTHSPEPRHGTLGCVMHVLRWRCCAN
eukprot:247509-Pelagomonas_calceolata.AAC.1